MCDNTTGRKPMLCLVTVVWLDFKNFADTILRLGPVKLGSLYRLEVPELARELPPYQ